MEQGLIIGYDLCKDYCRVSYFLEGSEEPADLVFSKEDNPYLVQNSICKKKGEDVWYIGQEGYEMALLGAGSVADKLLRLVSVGGSATFEGIKYTAEDLLYHFLDESLKILFKQKNTTKVDQIMYSIQELDPRILDMVIHCTERLGIERKRIHIISHTESYLYYLISQKRELWSNLAILYDLSGDGLNYYEMEVMRGMQPNIAAARRQFLEEGFSVDILEKESGRKMADNIMTSCVERMLDKKLVSSCFLSGNGMDKVQNWGTNFLAVLCRRRRVFFIENLFAKGAVYAACEYMRETSAYPFNLLCEGRINVDISMDVVQNGKKTLVLAEVGNNWYDTEQDFELIPDQETSLCFKVRKLGERSSKVIEVPLTGFPDRGNKLTRVGVNLKFTSQNTFVITAKDEGFGEMFPATEAKVRKEFTIE